MYKNVVNKVLNKIEYQNHIESPQNEYTVEESFSKQHNNGPFNRQTNPEKKSIDYAVIENTLFMKLKSPSSPSSHSSFISYTPIFFVVSLKGHSEERSRSLRHVFKFYTVPLISTQEHCHRVQPRAAATNCNQRLHFRQFIGHWIIMPVPVVGNS